MNFLSLFLKLYWRVNGILFEKWFNPYMLLKATAVFALVPAIFLWLFCSQAQADTCLGVMLKKPSHGNIIRSSYLESDPVIEALERLMPNLSSSPEIYICGQGGRCQSNVIRLARRIIEIMPELEPKDFNVLYITTERRFQQNKGRPVGFIVNDPKVPFVNSGWQHHVVLEYRGFVLDLDYSDVPTPVRTSEYFHRQFIGQTSNHPQQADFRDLIVFAIRGEDYIPIEQEPLIDIDTQMGQYLATRRGQSASLLDYF